MEVERLAQRAILAEHARAGVTFLGPDSTRVEAGVEIGEDTTLWPGVTLRGATRVGADCELGPNTTITDSTLGDRVTAPHAYLVEARVDEDATLGPFAYLRPGAHIGAGRQDRHLRGGQELRDRRGRQGAAPLLPRRRRRRRGQQHRGRQHHRQLRRQRKHRTKIGKNVRTERRHLVRRPGYRRGRGVHWRRIRDHRGRPRRRPRHRPPRAEQRRGIRRAQGRSRRSEHSRDPDRPSRRLVHTRRLRQAPDGGRRPREPGPGLQDRRAPGRRAHRRRSQDLLRRRGLLPLRGLDPRRRPVHRAVHLRLRARGPHRERRPDGADGHGARGQARLRAPDHRRDPLVRLLAPGQEVDAARADLRAAGRRAARDGGHRPAGHDGPPRRPGPGLLLQAGGPHDRHADPHPVRAGPARRTTTW